MRRIALIGLCVVTSMVAAPVARASDDCVRQVVKEQAARQIKQDKKFKSAVKKINSRAAGQEGTDRDDPAAEVGRHLPQRRQGRAGRYRAGQGGAQPAARGPALYNHGLDKLRTALTQAIKTNGRGGAASARAALRTVTRAQEQIANGARKIAG